MQPHYSTPDSALWRIGPISGTAAVDLVDALIARVPAAFRPRICAVLVDNGMVEVFLSERIPHIMTWLCTHAMPVDEVATLPDRPGHIWLSGGYTIKRWAERLNNDTHRTATHSRRRNTRRAAA